MASLSSLVDHGAPKISETMEYVADELRKEASEIMDEVSATPSKSFVPEFLQLMQKCRLIYTRIPELAQNQKTALPSVLVLSKPLIKHLMFYFFDSMGTAQFPAELLDDMTDVYQLFTDKDAFEVPFLHVFAAVILKPSGPSVKQLCAFIDTFKGRISAEGNSTLRFERVLNDLKQTEGINEKFRKKKKELPVEFRVNVLSAGAWPLTRDVPLKVLPEMQTCIRQFKDYYNSHTKERLLNFNLATGTVSFDYTYNGERCCISAHTTFLHSILALNSDKVFAPGSVGLSSGLDTAETESQLNCLVHLHLCNKNGKYYSFNKNFTPQSSTMWISNLPTEGKTVQKTPIKRKAERNEFDVSIDAAIVKTLKTEKRLNFSTIYQRVIARLSPSFEPSHYDVKRRIEILVGKEFITRDAKRFF
ncbi:cullin 2 [Angomonas deanei]|uniref:Cullin family/Cullin protein neddylation domain containing protein, putative n=1 Tax=Angomonas deanei TaxID=59799 RepID=A0A7G2C8U1_9TRYP|nr:cullin 2 [Angomonas deanei]CAD2214432.1 Cullin family/Cullin protein neddylation domain containing protein, putative [Angomonas deanei]|eukprot:EPY22472.1 cullin 2 [Angomonas deanei]